MTGDNVNAQEMNSAIAEMLKQNIADRLRCSYKRETPLEMHRMLFDHPFQTFHIDVPKDTVFVDIVTVNREYFARFGDKNRDYISHDPLKTVCFYSLNLAMKAGQFEENNQHPK